MPHTKDKPNPVIISFLSQKGGVGKTTLACFLAAFFREKNRLVALLDLDANQLSAVNWAGRRANLDTEHIKDVPAIGGLNMKNLERSLAPYQNYDILLIDAPGGADVETLKVAQASHLIMIPISSSLMTLQPQIMLVHGLQEQIKDIESKVIAFIISNSDPKETLGTREAQGQIAKHFGKTVITFETIIPSKRGYVVASNFGKTLAETSHNSLNDIANNLGDEVYSLITRNETLWRKS